MAICTTEKDKGENDDEEKAASVWGDDDDEDDEEDTVVRPAGRKPIRVQCRRTKGWRMPAGTVYVGRPGPYGNPFRIGDYVMGSSTTGLSSLIRATAAPGYIRIASAAQAVALHRAWVTTNNSTVQELRGKDLACWCKPGYPCHADTLLEIANNH